jgi:hypothetical protein
MKSFIHSERSTYARNDQIFQWDGRRFLVSFLFCLSIARQRRRFRQFEDGRNCLALPAEDFKAYHSGREYIGRQKFQKPKNWPLQNEILEIALRNGETK